MKKQLNEQISRIKDMMKKINEQSFEDDMPNIGEPSSVMDDDDDERKERNFGVEDDEPIIGDEPVVDDEENFDFDDDDEPSDDQIYNSPGYEGGIGYSRPDYRSYK